MKVLKSNEIETNSDDDFLYVQLQRLFEQIKITQGGTSLDATLRRHIRLKNYAVAKQIEKIKHIEEKYFNEDGSLRQIAIDNYKLKSNALQKHNNLIH